MTRTNKTAENKGRRPRRGFLSFFRVSLRSTKALAARVEVCSIGPLAMFEEQHLLGKTTRSILVQTRKGQNVENLIAPEPSHRNATGYERLRQKHGANWKNRKPACGFYNCFGHLFASRRTSIYEDVEVQKILEDDGLRELDDAEMPRIDDLVIYYYMRGTKRQFLHAARITEINVLEVPSGLRGALISPSPILTVLSKWSDCSGEDEHKALDVQHFNEQQLDFKAAVYTDRL